MQKRNNVERIMIYFLFIGLIVIGCKRGLDVVEQVSFSYHQIRSETLDTLPVLTNNEYWMEETEEKRFRDFPMEKQFCDGKDNNFIYSMEKLFVVMLLLLAVAGPEVYIHLQLYEYNPGVRIYHIIYMQNKDGRKKQYITKSIAAI